MDKQFNKAKRTITNESPFSVLLRRETIARQTRIAAEVQAEVDAGGDAMAMYRAETNSDRKAALLGIVRRQAK